MSYTEITGSSLISGLERQGDKVIVTFKSNGSRHSYAGINDDVWQDWQGAASVGSFFHQNIKGQYDSVKL